MRRRAACYFHATGVALRTCRKGALFLLPSVLDSKTFAKLANRQGAKLELQLYEEIRRASPHLHSSAFLGQAKEQARELCLPLTTLKREEVESTIAQKYKLTDDRLVTCLVPYQLGANILLSRLPPKVREESLRELKSEEAARQSGSPPAPNKWIQWYEADVYVSTGRKYLERISTRRQRRIPVFAVMGHVNHGKTALLDALQGSRIGAEEPHHITQSVRAFTMPRPGADNDLFTFIDTPGHRIFVETRFHVQLMADVIALVISVAEGIESQTHETIKVALNVDKPVIVVLNKLDLLSDALTAEKAVRRILAELYSIGLDVHLLQREKDVEALATKASTACCSSRGRSLTDLRPQAEYFAPMKTVDPEYKGSKRHPQVQLLRKSYGVCVSAATGAHIPFLWRVLQLCRDCVPPTCLSNSVGHTEHNAAVQAVVLESSKHLFDEEGFRLNRKRQQIQRSIDRKQEKRSKAFEQRSPRSRLNSVYNSVKTQSTRQNRTSSSSLVITAIVQEGVLTEGMHFIADQAEGQVHALVDYWGNRVEKAYPGMAVTLIDKSSMSGCPGAGIHVLSMTDLASRVRVQAYRQRLQWYAEIFTTKLHYLRPRGMDVSFSHLGDYGQLGITDSLECQLLYGPPQKPSEEQRQPEALPPGTSASDESIGAYLAERNRESESNALQVSSVGSVALPDGATKRLTQAIMGEDDEEVLKATWQSAQLQRQLTSQKEYEEHVAQCVQVGVLIKVDSWHTARMLHREISRLGTRKVYFQVVGARFGPLQVSDIIYVMQAVKIIVCFRTPLSASSDLDSYIENANLWVLQTDHFSDVVLFMKWCAVATHKEKVLDENDGDVDHGDESGPRPRIVVDPKKPEADSGAPRGSKSQRQRLLLYDDDNNDDEFWSM
ncbi:putative translation initiation factor IF-2 [Leishmania major strain Friedlin]|uniref:Putative translation initiation factor IF-2 n=1 Tax=Leishmania major TaxID=5664 RepID=Q4QAJ7_LEIMA|nr:putative translation initiation factor IF-2 [Leishmania major strain Friedlin]CAG9574605.1 translation_initiation_factor_IF-2_-_putative [Leishmania major strain Friedlin]CAJ04974.1 putative translation initiation factor IF-2 [Leishmania major strain Friedlin]|eukprot:XP_001683651.1 putative translation initiation factor IF-2 [Leishmania major strain Friedlin]